MNKLPSQVNVLIVGAGPAGLAAALALHKQGCRDMLVVDAILAGQNSSRALGVHAATLEALNELGCADELVKAGRIGGQGHLWDGYRFHAMEDYSVLTPYTKFPFMLFVPQRITERVLGERVKQEGIDVRRPHKVTDVRVSANGATLSEVVFEDGQVVKARYVVGADGARSTVRNSAGIGYVDPDGEGSPADGRLKQAVIADVVFTKEFPAGLKELLFILSSGNFLLLIPLPASAYDGKQAWRMAVGIPDSMGTPPHAPPTNYLQLLLDAYGFTQIPKSSMPTKEPLIITETVWSTRFRTHSAIADTPFTRLGKGAGAPVVLIGDAAHLHPPTGGQGMNLGLRDAFFLAPALMEHIRKSTGATSVSDRAKVDSVLKSWADSRHAQAIKVIGLAKGLLELASWKNEATWYFGIIPINWVRIRSGFMWLQDATGFKKRKEWELSGLANR